jgi:signal transduction histidine kinase
LAVVGEMASVVGHDLRNPLAAVLNSLYLLRVSLKEDMTEQQGRHIQVAEREIAKAASIVEHITEYVRPRKPVLAPFELGELIEEILEVTPTRAAVTVLVDVPVISIIGDRVQVGQVLTNLVTNALDAVGERGWVRIAASVESRRVVLSVEDDGPGIRPSLKDRIFEPFYTTKHQGTGLGLAIVRRLVEANGGSITLDHDASQGTRCLVTLRHHQLPTHDTATGEAAAGVAPKGPDLTAGSDEGPAGVREGQNRAALRSISIDKSPRRDDSDDAGAFPVTQPH